MERSLTSWWAARDPGCRRRAATRAEKVTHFKGGIQAHILLRPAVMRATRLLGVLFGGLLACGAAPGDGAGETGEEQDITTTAPSADEAKACDQASVGKDGTGSAVVHCKKPFTTAPFVRLPADAMTAAKATFYGGMTVPSTADNVAAIWSRDGKRYIPVDASGKPIPFGASGLPKTLHAPTNRITFTLYQFTGTLGAELDSPYGKATAITLSAVRPVVEVDGCAFDSRLAGTWSGTVSERLETPSGGGPFARAFDDTKRVPIHLTLKTLKKSNTLQDYTGGTRLADADTYMLSGTIDNFATDVTVDGKKYPSLQGMGKKNPFLGASNGAIQLYRLGNMHGQTNDGHWVLTYPAGSQALTTNGMSYTLTAFTAPSMLLAASAGADPLQSVEIKPHIPFTVNGHTMVIAPEHVGDQSGQCQ